MKRSAPRKPRKRSKLVNIEEPLSLTSVEQKQKKMASLPPCRVCGSPGAGFHYGVNTCEACKGFFHRSQRLSETYVCSGDNNCEVKTVKNQKCCQLCRYKKCLAVGMSKDAIKTGRYTANKRTKDILEVKAIQQKIVRTDRDFTAEEEEKTTINRISETLISPFTSPSPGNTPLSDTPNKHTNSPMDGTEFERLLNTNYTVETLQKQSSCTFPLDNVLSPESIHSLTLENSSQNFPINYENSPRILVDTQEASNDSFEPLQSTSQDVHRIPRPQAQTFLNPDTILLPGSSNSPEIKRTDPVLGISPTLSQSCCIVTQPNFRTSVLSQELERLNCYSGLDLLAHASDFQETNPNTAHSSSPLSNAFVGGYTDVEEKISAMFDNKEAVVKAMLDCDRLYKREMKVDQPSDVLLAKQKKHLEDCKQKSVLFGCMDYLPDAEYDEIYSRTGIDIDGRQAILERWVASLEESVRGIIKFATNVPMFKVLSRNDQVSLIKSARSEFNHFLCAATYNPDLGVGGTCCDVGMGLWCQHEIGRFSSHEFFRVMETVRNSILRLELTEEETPVARALILFFTDRGDLKLESPYASIIHTHFMDLFTHLLSKRSSRPSLIVARFIQCATELRTFTKIAVEFFYRQLKVLKYSSLLENPLLKELMPDAFQVYDSKDVNITEKTD